MSESGQSPLSRQSPFFSRPAPGSQQCEPSQVDYDDGQSAPAFPDPPEWRADSPLSGSSEAQPHTRATMPEGAPSPKPGVAAPVGQVDGNGQKKRVKRSNSNVGSKLYGLIELIIAVVILASICLLFAALVYGRYEEFISTGFWALGGGLTLALVFNLVGLFRR